MLRELITGDLFSLIFIFARIGAAVMLLPGFGENFIAARVRLMLAVGITVVIAPVVSPFVPPTPEGPLGMFAALGYELVVGLFFGAMARMMVSALHMAGVIIGFQTSLSNAQLFDPINAISIMGEAIFSITISPSRDTSMKSTEFIVVRSAC